MHIWLKLLNTLCITVVIKGQSSNDNFKVLTQSRLNCCCLMHNEKNTFKLKPIKSLQIKQNAQLSQTVASSVT